MKLYHGSNVVVTNPQIFESDRRLDFGTGFYLTTSYVQAQRWAVLMAKRRSLGEACVSIFDYDENSESVLNVLKFENANVDWIRFVSANRKKLPLQSEFDIVFGPVANDKTMSVIMLYFAGIYTEYEAIERLLPQNLEDQVVFKSEKSLRYLKFVEVVR